MYNYLFTDYRYGMMRHHYGYYGDYSGFGFYINSFLVVIAYILLITSTIFLLRGFQQSSHNAMTILENRLTRGEISIEEYNQIKEIISNKNNYW